MDALRPVPFPRVAKLLGPPLAHGSRSTVYEWGDDAVVKVPFADTPDEWIRYEARRVTFATILPGRRLSS